VTACFFGDGAVAEGEFHESLNLAALWKLPVLFLCENNLYAMGTRIERALSQTDVASKARTYGITAESVDGMDVVAVEAAARRAADTVRAEGGPFFLECRTYRFRAHSMFDAELYRDRPRSRNGRSATLSCCCDRNLPLPTRSTRGPTPHSTPKWSRRSHARWRSPKPARGNRWST
jgi:TPP-dependent pyruvate/acetoin dehydrogenase alpha subunit